MQDRTLYVLDDDSLVRQIVQRTGEMAGYAIDGFDGICGFQRALCEAVPDLILLDLAIGNEDGVSVLEGLRRIGCASPILMISGFDERVLASSVRFGRSLGLNMLDPLRKPLLPSSLSERLKRIRSTALPIRSDDVYGALADCQLVPFYQPKVNVCDRRVIGAEALVRWNHPERGLLPPCEFLPVTEAGPAITPLTYFTIEQAMQRCMAWRSRGFDLSVAVNVSAKSLVVPEFPERVIDIVRSAGASPANLSLEITETSAMADTGAILSTLTRFRIRNITLSIDDFGTGYSSLRELHRMPFSELKIDRSFVHEIASDRDAYVITKAIAALAATLGMKTVAEGVENEETFAILAEIGCDIAQGYLIGRPIPSAAFESWLEANRSAEVPA